MVEGEKEGEKKGRKRRKERREDKPTIGGRASSWKEFRLRKKEKKLTNKKITTSIIRTIIIDLNKR